MPIGLALSERFYATAVAPLIATVMPGLNYGAARLGNGSEVLGLDTTMSADHNYGPTVQIFLSEADFADHALSLMRELDRRLPNEIDGWSTRFPSFDRPVGRQGWLCSDHGVELMTIEAMLQAQLGVGLDPPTLLEWLGFPEQLLLSLTAGAVFRDDAGRLSAVRDQLAWFPRDIWLLRLAAQWSRVAEERAFVGRTGELGDDLGSRLVAARLVQDLMRLAFLVDRRYAPYAKWIGTAFARLPSASRLTPLLEAALRTASWQERERYLAEAARTIGMLQLERKTPGAVPPHIHRYFGRPFEVINADEIADGLRAAITDPDIRALSHAGAVDQFSDSPSVLTQPRLNHELARAIAGNSDRSL